MDPSAYSDHFAREHLPPEELWPVFEPEALARLAYPKRMNAAFELIDRAVAAGFGARPCLRTPAEVLTYDEVLNRANRIAHVLVRDLGLMPGNRVLLRSANNLTMATAWLGVLKAGGIAVATMPLLRARELAHVRDKARIQIALCDARLADEWQSVGDGMPGLRTLYFGNGAADSLENRMARASGTFDNVICSHDDVALIAFTSGTTGPAKATMHFHRDVLAICDSLPGPVLKPTPDDVFAGSAPFAFTFGLGALLLFPLRFGASAVLLEQATPDIILSAIAQHRVTFTFTVPTLYRAMTPLAHSYDVSSLRAGVSSGEHLPVSVAEGWRKQTGISLINSIGSTEMLHAFLAMPPGEARANAVGRPLPGFRAAIFDDDMQVLPPHAVGKLGVRGPTGCRYLDDTERQRKYVRDGWNLTGDSFWADEEGLFWYHARSDDMIVSAGYNISGAEVEEVLLDHPAVRECAVVGVADDARGQIVTAFIVLNDPSEAGDAMTKDLQDRVKSTIAPYKYPRAIAYLDALPKTVTGKVQRSALRDGQV
ncbi:MAG: 2-aminobenzoate-CoA ligase [Xanthobacteraceae bacterium]|nr:2-aminobenzoate-CoA ligase [Xanthobacteraceae bacterium]